MMKKIEKTIPLSPGELEIMELFWSDGGKTLAQAHAAFLKQGRSIGYTTVQTRLNRLVDKGLLCKSDTHPCVYEVVVPKHRVSGKFFDLFEKLCGGNAAALVVHLLKQRKFTPGEIEAFREILDRKSDETR